MTSLLLRTQKPAASSPLSLHDALPISPRVARIERNRRDATGVALAELHHRAGTERHPAGRGGRERGAPHRGSGRLGVVRSEEHTSELQSQFHLVCRLLLEKKKKIHFIT